jgi:hypothetical protein
LPGIEVSDLESAVEGPLLLAEVAIAEVVIRVVGAFGSVLGVLEFTCLFDSDLAEVGINPVAVQIPS